MKRNIGILLLAVGAAAGVAAYMRRRSRRLDLHPEDWGFATLGGLTDRLVDERVFDSMALAQSADEAGWPVPTAQIERSERGVFLHFELADGWKVSLRLVDGTEDFIVSSWSHPDHPQDERAELPTGQPERNIRFEDFVRSIV